MHFISREVYEYLSKKNSDPILERRRCSITWHDFPIIASKQNFLKKIAPRLWEKTYSLPFPTLCPEARHMRRMLFRNDRTLYKSTCSKTGTPLISMFAPEKEYTVVDRSYWRSDNRSAQEYWMSFNFGKTFAEQFDTLLRAVPLPSLLNSNSTNSSYVNQTDSMKNSYLMFSCCDDENCYYGNRVFDSFSCLDCSIVYDSQYCYECIDGKNLYECFYSQYLTDSSQCYFCFDCHGCTYCFWCNNLQWKQYHIHNIPHTKDEYEVYISEVRKKLWSYSYIQEQKKKHASRLTELAYYPTTHVHDCVDTDGWFLAYCKRTRCCFEWEHLENCMNWLLLRNTKNVHDGNNTVDAERQYEVSTWWINAYHQLFCLDTRPNCSHLMYCAYCANSSHSFWSVWLKQQSYSIFNRSYPTLAYEQTVWKIIEHMRETGERGEFFDPAISPFGYNESAAFEYFPLSKTEAKSYKLPWYTTRDMLLPPSLELPDHIDQTQESHITKPVTCIESKKWFRITNQEFLFYKKHAIPLPRLHPDIRHLQRFHIKLSRSLHLRPCDKTWEEMLSVYQKDIPYKVYSEEVYQKEMYW